jgi:alkanesulfonate monooxygenase SsuD/methylene tetrahydromethanopterin reductase-like flavin-dependent oxidoreductase (luciferase family)
MSPTTGVWIYPDATIGELVDAIVRADRAGVDEVWIADEGVMRDPVVAFAAAAASTERVRMGIGITSPILRHPGAIAATVATLDELSGGRMMLGFGVGGALSLEPFGLVPQRPVAVMRDAIRTARAVLQRRDAPGYRVPHHAAPARDVPIYVASRGEQINRLASREADGVFLSGFAVDGLDDVMEWVRSEGSPRVALYQSVRLRSSASGDPSAVAGTPAQVAEVLSSLVATHAPDSIGVALVDGDDLATMMDDAIAVLDHLVSSRRQQSRMTSKVRHVAARIHGPIDSSTATSSS